MDSIDRLIEKLKADKAKKIEEDKKKEEDKIRQQETALDESLARAFNPALLKTLGENSELKKKIIDLEVRLKDSKKTGTKEDKSLELIRKLDIDKMSKRNVVVLCETLSLDETGTLQELRGRINAEINK